MKKKEKENGKSKKSAEKKEKKRKEESQKKNKDKKKNKEKKEKKEKKTILEQEQTMQILKEEKEFQKDQPAEKRTSQKEEVSQKEKTSQKEEASQKEEVSQKEGLLQRAEEQYEQMELFVSETKAEEAELNLAEIYRALGDESRLQILELLDQKEMCGSQLLELVSIVQSTLSHHMKVLCETGLVVCSRKGRMSCYRKNKKVFQRLAEIMKKEAE